MSFEQEQECPICMELIEENCDKTVTKCGHIFHSSCIFQNMAAHNGFGCPYCRTTLAVESEDSDNDSDNYTLDEMNLEEEEYVFTSFRMFHQRLNNEEIEEEQVEEDNEETNSEDDEEKEIEDKTVHLVNYLNSRGITYKQLVRYILLEQDLNISEDRYDHEYSVIYGQFRAGINRFDRSIRFDHSTNNVHS